MKALGRWLYSLAYSALFMWGLLDGPAWLQNVLAGVSWIGALGMLAVVVGFLLTKSLSKKPLKPAGYSHTRRALTSTATVACLFAAGFLTTGVVFGMSSILFAIIADVDAELRKP